MWCARVAQRHTTRIVVRCGEEVVAEHPRYFGRNRTIYDPWHYLPVLARKPGALRNGAPFQDWDLPPALARLRRETILDPAIVEALNAKAEKAAPARHTVRRSAPRSDRTPVAELQAEPKRQGFFLFNLFGG